MNRQDMIRDIIDGLHENYKLYKIEFERQLDLQGTTFKEAKPIDPIEAEHIIFKQWVIKSIAELVFKIEDGVTNKETKPS